jgi:multicomponent K+:H+ antiporter subunit A
VQLSHGGVRLLGTTRLQSQVFLVIGVAVLLAVAASQSSPFTPGDRPRLPASPAFALLWVIGMVCAVGVAVQAKFHRMVALTLLGGAGLVTSLTFVWFSAPDLALTQLSVEVVTTILFLLGLRSPGATTAAGRATSRSRSAREAASRCCRMRCSPVPRRPASRRSS